MSMDGYSIPQTQQQLELQLQYTSPPASDVGSASPASPGTYYEFRLKNGNIINLELLSTGDHLKDTTSPGVTLTVGDEERELTRMSTKETQRHEKRENIFHLIPDSTNAWLYIRDSDGDDETKGCCSKCTDNLANKIIAVVVLFLQIAAYLLMTNFLRDKRLTEYQSREDSCYGPNCNIGYKDCMDLTTGGLMSVLLIGFLWADVVNTFSICGKSCHWFCCSFFVLLELITAIVCGFLVGIYSENDFDAIGGAVGILFVHDLDEKVFASMQVFRNSFCGTCKKLTGVTLWITVSIGVAVFWACKFHDGSYFNYTGEFQCRQLEFECSSDTSCIWEGYVCNGVQDCSDGSDEGTLAGCAYQAGLENDYCPEDRPFMCEEDGSCLEESKRCDGIIDCPLGSDEGREQHCQKVIEEIDCGGMNVTALDPNSSDSYHMKWTGYFKCTSGQCIDAQYACDGVPGDCVDGSDEYPNFYGNHDHDHEDEHDEDEDHEDEDDHEEEEFAWVSCPYHQLIVCGEDEVLCKIDGHCIPKDDVCDGIKDCPDGADEALCEYECQEHVLEEESFQCGGQIAWVLSDIDAIVTFEETAMTNFSVGSSQNVIWYNDTDDIDYLFENATGECIPIQWRCDGTYDCADGSDEKLCEIIECPVNQYQCLQSGQCIPDSWLCDGYSDCINGDDELGSICEDITITEYANITHCGETESGTLELGESKYFRFNAAEINGISPIDFNGCASVGDTIMSIHEESDLVNYVAYNDDDYLGNCASNLYASYVSLSYDATYSGDYFLRVYLYDYAQGGNYQFSVVCN